jgi:hypothetical protein
VPAPRDHIVQLYQDQQFLNRAVCRFAAGALERDSAALSRRTHCPERGPGHFCSISIV